jgi:hypothetical protein
MPKSHDSKTTSKKIDLIYISLGILTVLIVGIAIFNTPYTQQYAGAQTNPSSPGGGKVELPKSSPVKAEEPKPVNNPVIDVPTPDAPSIDVEEIDEAGNSTTIIVDNGGNLKPPVYKPDTAIKTEPTTTSAPTTVETTKTVRSGGSAVWVTILAVLGVAGATYYYKKKGNRKSNFKMTEK